MSLYDQHQAALAELKSTKRNSLRLNPVFRGALTDIASLARRSEAIAEMERASAQCTALAKRLAAGEM
jgi:hypothetical protein